MSPATIAKTYRLAEPVDFAIVGSGAAGGVLARELSQAGFSVVVFEQGPRHTLADFQHDELKNWFSSGLINDVVKSTCRMGDDPTKSVVDRYHRSHDIPNLFVCDGSSLVTSGRGQPTLTIQALAFRAAEHIASFARKNEI